MNKLNFKQFYPHLIAFALILASSFVVFFFPVLKGKDLKQMDITHAKAAAKELVDYQEKTGEVSMWTNSMFSGMPAYQIKGSQNSNVFYFLMHLLQFKLPYHTVAIFFMYLLFFYILLASLKYDPWLCFIGALAFTFATYNVIIVQVGHVTKAYAIALIPLVIAGVIQIFRNNFIVGLLITSIGIGIEIVMSHIQITYYLFLLIIVIVLTYFFYAYKDKTLKNFFKQVGLLLIAAILGVIPNVTSLWTTYEYGKETLRGPSELKAPEGEKKSGGLDIDYAFAWSYGKAETGTIIIPYFMGGSNNESLDKSSHAYKVLQQQGIPNAEQLVQNLPMYWGEMPFTSAPVYFGALVCFLFVLGLFVVKGPEKWWLLIGTVLSIVLSWGNNFSILNDFFFYYFPLYNKFRTVSMTLVIAGFTMPLLAFMALKQIVDSKKDNNQLLKQLYYSVIITGGFCLLFILLPGLFFDFKSSSDQQLKGAGFPDWLIDAIRLDRKALLQSDAFRSLAFVLIGAFAIWTYLKGKINKTYLYMALTVLMLVDLVPVGKRYLDSNSFVAKKEVKEVYKPTAADLEILKDESLDYRVYNLTVSPFNDASTSYFHKSIGGYHGAKLRRYQELYDRHISKNNINVINMLNAKYFIISDENKQPIPQLNPGALGNCWLVNDYKLVDSPDAELNALGDSTFNPSKTIIVDKRFTSDLKDISTVAKLDSNDRIKLIDYKPNDLTYESISSTDRLAVFSEIYYEKGWNAYVDGVLKPHFRSNYVLRTMIVPKGKHKIEFKFEPKSFYLGEKIAFFGSSMILLLIIFFIYRFVKKPSEPSVA